MEKEVQMRSAQSVTMMPPPSPSPSKKISTPKVKRKSSDGMMTLPVGEYHRTTTVIQSASTAEITRTGEQGKKDMQILNKRFGDYIDKVHFLEAQNRNLSDELEKLKSAWSKRSLDVKLTYETKVTEATRLLEESKREKKSLKMQLRAARAELEELRQRFEHVQKASQLEEERSEKLIHQISAVEAEIGQLRRRAELYDRNRDKDKKLIELLKQELQTMRTDLEKKCNLLIDAENRRETLEEEQQFIKIVHEQEVKELASLAYRDTTSENREYWKTEMGQALREIQQAYDDQVERMRLEMESYYSIQMAEIKQRLQLTDKTYYIEENKRLKGRLNNLYDKINQLDTKNTSLVGELGALRHEKEEIERHLTQQNVELQTTVMALRAETQAIQGELKNISAANSGLVLEINAYRKLLESEENRADRRHTVREDKLLTTSEQQANGPIIIADSSVDGKFVQLENTGNKEENLGGWSLKRNIDGVDTISLRLPKNLVLKPGDNIKIWAKGAMAADAEPTDLELDKHSWGSGKIVITKLISPTNEDRASHILRTTSVTSSV